MFRHLPTYSLDPNSLAELGVAMIQGLEDGKLDKPLGVEDDDENTATLDGELRIPSGYTYFGQFVDHDITFDPVSSLTRQNDPQALTDFRTPRYDLDSVYGRGPSTSPTSTNRTDCTSRSDAPCRRTRRCRDPTCSVSRRSGRSSAIPATTRTSSCRSSRCRSCSSTTR